MSKLFAAQGREVRHETVDVYYKSLSKMTSDQWEHAVNRSVENDEMFPKIPKLWAYARELRKKVEGESLFFSFLHEKCDLPFGVRIEDLTVGRYFDCAACDTYSKEKVRWSGEFLKKKMEEAKMNNSQMAIL